MLQYQQEVRKGAQLPYHTMTWSVSKNEHICLHTHINIFLDNYEKWVRHIQTLIWYCRFEEKSIPLRQHGNNWWKAEYQYQNWQHYCEHNLPLMSEKTRQSFRVSSHKYFPTSNLHTTHAVGQDDIQVKQCLGIHCRHCKITKNIYTRHSVSSCVTLLITLLQECNFTVYVTTVFMISYAENVN